MKKEFWLERWDRGEIGFHQNDINPYLLQYWQELLPAQGSKVFVPLCGKSRDLLWLRRQGHSVVGVELSSIAVQAFFKENNYTTHQVIGETFEHCQADDIHILCGDFFDLSDDHLTEVSLVYDRASLVALPPEMRESYVNHLVNILRPGTQILLLAFDYNQREMSGPPFAVSADEVESLFSGRARIHLLAQFDTLSKNPRFQERGLSRLQENIYLLTLC